jgi:hypothetical protein
MIFYQPLFLVAAFFGLWRQRKEGALVYTLPLICPVNKKNQAA